MLLSITTHLTGNICSVTAPKIAYGPSWRGAGGCLSTLPSMLPTALTPLGHLDLFPEQLLCPCASATTKARLRGPSDDDWSCAGQRMMLQTSAVLLYMCTYPRMIFSEMWGCCLSGRGREFSFHQKQIFPHLSPCMLQWQDQSPGTSWSVCTGLIGCLWRVTELWLSVFSIYNYIKPCKLIMIHLCLKWEACHLFTASSCYCPSCAIWKCVRFSEAAANEHRSRWAPFHAVSLQQDHCPWVISGPLWELLREHPGFICNSTVYPWCNRCCWTSGALHGHWDSWTSLKKIICFLKRLMLCTV